MAKFATGNSPSFKRKDQLIKPEKPMKKEVKDYLHLYLGCDISYDGKTWTLYMVSNMYAFLRRGKDGREKCTIHLHESRPVLRPLAAMSDDEEKEMVATQDKINFKGFNLLVDSGETCRYLLSKYFDLFGLIEAGLAIESPTKPHNQ